MPGLFTFSSVAASVVLLSAGWLVAWAVINAAAITESTSGVLYSHPSTGNLITGILGFLYCGALQLQGLFFAVFCRLCPGCRILCI